MNKLNKKINAFTISELLVVLVISSLVVSLSLVVLNLVQKQIASIQKGYAKNTEIELLERALIQDFNRFSFKFHLQTNQLIGNSVNDTVKYTIAPTTVIRNYDTLHIPIFKTITYLDGVEVRSGAVDAIQLQLSEEFVEHKLFVAKTKDATFYMNDDGI